MKLIIYNEIEYEVEDNYNYTATDFNGQVWAFVECPKYYDGRWDVIKGDSFRLSPVSNTKSEDSLVNI